MAEPSTPAGSGRLRRVARAFVALGIGLGVTLVAFELGLRWLVLSPSESARKLGAALRQPGNFANEDVDEVFWKLQRKMLDESVFGDVPGYDAQVGWVGDLVEPGTYRHFDAPSVGDRTPVLFFGDSFAQCVVPKPQCFQALVERSDLNDRYRLLNYGVGGFGFDQAFLMMTRTVDHWKDKHPIVVLSLLVESDLDRAILDFRGWPKPRLVVQDGEARPRDARVPTVDEYFEQHGLDAGSLLWRALVYRRVEALAPWQERMQVSRARIDEKKELAHAILTSAHRMLEERGVRHFLLLFNVRGPLDAPQYTWQEPFLRETCAELGLPLISVRPWFDLVIEQPDWKHSELYYISEGPGAGHYNAAGNEIAFEALRAGILGQFDSADTSRLRAKLERRELPAPTDRLRQLKLLGHNAWITARAERSVVRAGTRERIGSMYDPGDESEALCIRGGELGATKVAFDLDESAQTFRAELLAVKRPGVECAMPRLDVEITLRDESVFHGEVGAQPTPIELDLTGAKSLAITVASRDGDSECGWVVVAHPRFEPK